MSTNDIISSMLPQKIIGRILSFLPTKDAVRTSILSKRWRSHWKLITKLDFDDSEFYIKSKVAKRVCHHCGVRHTLGYHACHLFTLCWRCKFGGNLYGLSDSEFSVVDAGNDISAEQVSFERFVWRVLFNTSNIEGLSFSINYEHPVESINSWISSILQKGVKNLRIHSPLFVLPFFYSTYDYLFADDKLEELELILQKSSSIRIPQSTVRMGHLKLLKLSGVVFLTFGPSNIPKILSLPVLIKFEIKNCTWSKGMNVVVDAPLLERVSIELFLIDVDPGASIKFDSMHLKEFAYCGFEIAETISLPNILSCASVEIILKPFTGAVSGTRKDSGARCLAFLIRQIKHVKSIKFEGIKPRQSDIPDFLVLSNLDISFVTIQVLLGLLRKSPVLKTLVLKGISEFSDNILNSAGVPKCLISTLEFVKFKEVKLEPHERFLANFFIKNGLKLEKIYFSLASKKLLHSKILKIFKGNIVKKSSVAAEFAFD